jgi:hypothetical protein
MPDDFNFVPPERRLEDAGFRLTRLEDDPSIVYLLGADLRIVYCNKAWDDFAASNGGVGLNREAVLGASVMEAIAMPLRPFYARAFTGRNGNRGPGSTILNVRLPSCTGSSTCACFPWLIRT